jgi:hypothetical protein
LFLPALLLATVAASAAAVLTLDRYTTAAVTPHSEPTLGARPAKATSNVAQREDRQPFEIVAPAPIAGIATIQNSEVAAALRQQDHDHAVAEVAPHIAALMMPTISDDPLRDEGADAVAEMLPEEDWTTETQPNAEPAPGPRIAVKAEVLLPWQKRPAGSNTVSLKERLAAISPGASKRLVAKFLSASAPWPPAEIGLVAIKDKKIVELHARSAGGDWKLVHEYKVLAASGKAGPKLVQGDYQVPEGVYGISFLNPNSRYHVALRVDYPNAFDRRMAEKDGRKNLGGDIMIHGKNLSRGCLAIGDAAAEELFVLADMTGLKNVKVVIAPTDFRKYGVPEVDSSKPKWMPQLYTQVASAMSDFKAPPSIGLLSFFGN